MHRIVVDAMGGDHAPDEVVRGAAEASLALHNAEIILVGDAAVLGRLLPRMRPGGRHPSAPITPWDTPAATFGSVR